MAFKIAVDAGVIENRVPTVANLGRVELVIAQPEITARALIERIVRAQVRRFGSDAKARARFDRQYGARMSEETGSLAERVTSHDEVIRFEGPGAVTFVRVVPLGGGWRDGSGGGGGGRHARVPWRCPPLRRTL